MFGWTQDFEPQFQKTGSIIEDLGDVQMAAFIVCWLLVGYQWQQLHL